MISGGFTLRNEQRDFVEWHRGRAPYVLWALDVDVTPIQARSAAAARHLDGLLLPGYVRQAHVTLALCGFAADDEPAPDEFAQAALLAAAGQVLAAGVEPFEITVGGLASFSSAPYLAVADHQGGIARLRHHLSGPVDDGHRDDYVPHVTVGLYRDAWPLTQVLERLAAFADDEPLVCRVERVALMGYQPAVIGGRLQTLGEICLDRGRLSPALLTWAAT